MSKKNLFLAVMLTVALNMGAQTLKKEWVNTLIDRIKLSGYAQGGFVSDSQGDPKDQFKAYRIFFMAQARVVDNLDVYMMLDLYNPACHELWAKYTFCDAFRVTVGQFKNPFTLENSLSPTVTEMIFPYSLATNYMIAGSSPLMMQGGAGRDQGVMLSGDVLDKWISYDLALTNGTGRSKADNNSQKDFTARLTLHPLSALSLSGSFLTGTGNLPVTLASDGTYHSADADISGLKANGNYHRERYAAGMSLETSPLNLRSEYMAGKDGHTWSHGFYATTSVNNVLLKHLDVIASYDNLDLASGITRRYTGGLQYWFYPRCRVQVTYSHTNANHQPSANAVMTQLQVRF